MRTAHALRLLSLVGVLLACGCSSNNTGKLEGTKWSSLNAKIKGMEFTSGAATLEFRKDGKFVWTMAGIALNGTYSLGMGDNVSMTFNSDRVKHKNASSAVVVKEDLMTMTDPDGTKMMWVREK